MVILIVVDDLEQHFVLLLHAPVDIVVVLLLSRHVRSDTLVLVGGFLGFFVGLIQKIGISIPL